MRRRLLLGVLAVAICAVLIRLMYEPAVPAVRFILGWTVVMFLPGCLAVRMFLSNADVLERAMYSFAISIAVAVGIGLLLNWIGKVSLLPILVSYSSFIIIAALGLAVKSKVCKKAAGYIKTG